MKGKVNWWQRLKPKLWSLMDEPYSSFAAKVTSIGPETRAMEISFRSRQEEKSDNPPQID